ncbi:TetR/AcrR family transcriptional regulator [Streptomyces sp. NPDC046985]|uniref:TetR/AcrR family transcriptional regulator n=1 Tax=Streptomyces sp. NPDC046985 TaxID=3155377 RepID=UPI0033D7126D
MARTAGAGGVPRSSVWLRGGPRRGGRGGQPSGLDRERITGATVRLLDAEGLDRFSMRRLAAELKVSAMSVYWYVDTKDDLLELALDAAFGELRLPDPDADGDWRGPLRALAAEYRAHLVRHPWLSPLAGRYLNIGPHHMAFSHTVRRVVRRTGLPAHRVTGAIAAVFQFVYGYGTLEGRLLSRAEEGGTGPGAGPGAYGAPVARDEEREGPRTATGAAAPKAPGQPGEPTSPGEFRDRDFDFALDLLIAGIEAMVARG